MTQLLTGMIGFGLLFGLFGAYALSRPRRSCSGSCTSCASAAGCELADTGGRSSHRAD